MVDCGFSMRQVNTRLTRLGVRPQEIDALLVTHEHSDHWSGVVSLASKFNIPVYLTAGSRRVSDTLPASLVNIINGDRPFAIRDFTITPVPVPHDAREPVQFIVDTAARRCGILTDIGRMTPHVVQHYQSCDALFLEANHDADILFAGPYPAFLKERVSGGWGHLNNQQAVDFVQKVNLSQLQYIVFGHISEQNNCLDRLRELVATSLLDVGKVHYASQGRGLDWLVIQ